MESLFNLSGKTALVTGASGSLGSCFARTLAAHGATVVLAARRTGKLQALATDITANGGRAITVAMDVRDASSIRDALDEAQAAVGVATILVNNAGLSRAQPALQLSEADWDEVVNTNLKGAWLVAQECARRMVAAGCGGSIINIASILGHRVTTAMAPYIASKAALVRLGESLALEWARHDIRVNNIAPGYIASDMNRAFFQSKDGAKVIQRIPQRRIGAPADLDGALLLLASDASRYMTGSTLVVDGGHLCSSL